MKKIFILILTLTSLNYAAYASNSFEISDIYIDAQGNNKYEAKIKAHEKGMYRALLILADKIGINHQDLEKISYTRMKDPLVVSSIINEVETAESYSATVSYKYDLGALNKVLLAYGNHIVDEKFYEYLILPIFKQRKILNLWDETQGWNKLWAAERAALEQHRLYYPKASRALTKVLNEQNIFNYSYGNYLEAFQSILFKKVMLLVCEYFTDVNTGEAVMVVNSIIIGPDEDKKLASHEYQIENQEEIPLIMEDVIAQIIRDHGKLRDGISYVEKALNVSDEIMVAQEYGQDERTIMLNIEVFDEEELESIKSKLQNVKEIDSFVINHDYDKKYKVIVKTSKSEAEIAEGFYQNGLSFKIYGNLYNLIDVKEGG
jgi:hypothetical protein